MILIPLEPRTKKNHQQIINNGKLRVIPSKQYREYEEQAKWFLKPLGIDYAVNIKCLFYMKTHRKVDLTNLLEAIDDVMVKAGLLVDDNSNIIVSHDGSRVLYDKEKPRTEIYIERSYEHDISKAEEFKADLIDTIYYVKGDL